MTANAIPSDAELETMENNLRNLKSLYNKNMVKRAATPAHGNKQRGVGITRKAKSKSKKNLRIEKNSRRRNRR